MSKFDEAPVTSLTGSAKAQLFDSPWLSGDDLGGKTVVATIEGVHQRSISWKQGEAPEVSKSIKFVGKKKELKLNATTAKDVIAVLGDDIDGWLGQRVALSPVMTRMPNGSTKNAVFVSAAPAAGPAAQRVAAKVQPQGFDPAADADMAGDGNAVPF